MKMFGLPTGFETTAGKQVDDARCHISGVLTKTTRQVRNRTEVGRRGLPTPHAPQPPPSLRSLLAGGTHSPPGLNSRLLVHYPFFPLTQARQFMNRRGGFNRPLPVERTGQIVPLERIGAASAAGRRLA